MELGLGTLFLIGFVVWIVFSNDYIEQRSQTALRVITY